MIDAEKERVETTDRDPRKHGLDKCIILSQALQRLCVTRYVDENCQGIFRNRLNHRG